MTALDELDAVWDKLASLRFHRLDAPQTLAVLDRLEIHRRRQPVVEHALITHVQSRATAKEMGAKSWRAVLSNRLGIAVQTPGAASPRPLSSESAEPSPASRSSPRW